MAHDNSLDRKSIPHSAFRERFHLDKEYYVIFMLQLEDYQTNFT